MDLRRNSLHFWRMHWISLAAKITICRPPIIYQCEATWSWSQPRFSDFDLWVILDGEGRLEINGRQGAVARGDGVLFRPGDSVLGSHDPGRPLRVFACHFDLEEGPRQVLANLVPRQLRFRETALLEAVVIDLVRDFHQPSPPTDGSAELRLTYLLAQAARDVRLPILDAADERIRQLCLEISIDPSRDRSPSALARAAGLSVAQFNRRFRALTGASPARYQITRRIDRARELLRETPLTLQQIADALGYRDIYYFHRQYRRETGQTPAEARRQFRRSGG